jgi:hypothetical protein
MNRANIHYRTHIYILPELDGTYMNGAMMDWECMLKKLHYISVHIFYISPTDMNSVVEYNSISLHWVYSA